MSASRVHWLPRRPCSWPTTRGRAYWDGRAPCDGEDTPHLCGRRGTSAPELVQVTCLACLDRAAKARWEPEGHPCAPPHRGVPGTPGATSSRRRVPGARTKETVRAVPLSKDEWLDRLAVRVDRLAAEVARLRRLDAKTELAAQGAFRATCAVAELRQEMRKVPKADEARAPVGKVTN